MLCVLFVTKTHSNQCLFATNTGQIRQFSVPVAIAVIVEFVWIDEKELLVLD